MQPRRIPARSPATCAICNEDIVGRSWRIRNINNTGSCWHPRCFTRTYPDVTIENQADAAAAHASPPIPQHNPADIDHSSPSPHTNPQAALPRNPWGTPDQPLHPQSFPSLHGLRDIEWDDIYAPTQTAKTIPPQCRAMYCELLHQTCNHINTNTTTDADATMDGWKLLMALPRFILGNTQRARAGRKSQGNMSHTRTIRRRIAQVYAGHWDTLLEESTPAPTTTNRRKQGHPDRSDTNDAAAILKHLENGETREALRIISGSPEIAKAKQILEELPHLFLQTDEPTPKVRTTHPLTGDIVKIKEQIRHILLHTPKHRGAGPAGERYEHFAIAARHEAALDSLTDTIATLVDPSAPPKIRDALASARIIPLLKPDGKIRPIACGTIIRRILATAISHTVTREVTSTIKPYQYALTAPRGAEHLHKYIQARIDTDKNTAVLSLDVKAAFADLSRAHILRTIHQYHPSLEPLPSR